MQASENIRPIESYSDYRRYLQDRFSLEKTRRKTFSHQYCATKLGTNKVYLKHVIERRRHITLEKLPAIAKLFRLTDFELQYFVFLFLKNTTANKSISGYFESILFSLRQRKRYAGEYSGRTQAPVESEILFTSWLSMVVHSLARFPDFKPDPIWISEKLSSSKATPDAIRPVLKRLLDHKMIIEENGKYRPGEFVFREANYFDLDQFKIYRVGLAKALDALDHIADVHPRHFHMMSVGLDEPNAEKAIELMKNLRDQIITLSKTTQTPTKVFFVSNNFFAVTK